MRADTTTVIRAVDPDPVCDRSGGHGALQLADEAPDGGTPTGSVTVSDGTESCTGTVAAGQCTLAFTTAGTRSLSRYLQR